MSYFLEQMRSCCAANVINKSTITSTIYRDAQDAIRAIVVVSVAIHARYV